MNVSTRTLAAVCLTVVSVVSAHAAGYKSLSVRQSIVSCQDLACFGQLALSEKMRDGTLPSTVELYSKAECQEFAAQILPGDCKVITKPRFAYQATAWTMPRSKRSYEGCHDFACFGTVYIGQLFYDEGVINAVALANKSQCDAINAAAESSVGVPCFRLDSIPPHFSQEEVEDSLKQR